MKVSLVSSLLVLLVATAQGLDWWQAMSLYQIYPRSFKDSDGDGIGDLKGIESKLQHLKDSGVDAFWLSPIYTSPMADFGYDIADFKNIDKIFGTITDFESLLANSTKLGLKVIMDFVPNHSSDEHEWFQKSVKKIDPYTDYYVWHDGIEVNGTRIRPNNWVSVFSGSAWEWNKVRKAYYFHQFDKKQPDLNYRNKYLVEEMKNVLRFWLDKGVAGFRVDAIPHLFEDAAFPDEPLSERTFDPDSYDYTVHDYTKNQNETYSMVHQWSEVLKEYTDRDNNTRIMMMEAYENATMQRKYYEAGAQFPFNFGLIGPNNNTSASEFKDLVDYWMTNMPENATANWVVGNHDQHRLATRYGGSHRAQSITAMALLLPGVGITYNGEEIGMENGEVSWEQTVDPSGLLAGEEGYIYTSRDFERTPFQWDNTTSAGFSTSNTTWLPVASNYLTVNLAAEKEAKESYYKFYLELAALKKWPSVREGELETQVLGDNVFAFSRVAENEDPVYVLINVGEKEEVVSLEGFTDVPTEIFIYTTTTNSGLTKGTIVRSTTVKVPAVGTVILTSASIASTTETTSESSEDPSSSSEEPEVTSETDWSESTSETDWSESTSETDVSDEPVTSPSTGGDSSIVLPAIATILASLLVLFRC